LWVFARADGSPWEPGAFSLAFARLVKNSKLPHIRFHDLRHSFGTLALASGVDLQTVSRALGHESTAITSRIYLHAIDTLQDDAAARIDALLGNAVAGALAKPPIPVSPAVTHRQAHGDKESVPQPCHKSSLQTKNARRFERFVVAPTGIEPANRCPGRSPVEYRIVLSCTGFRVF
ncbi:MAG: tyrosine-type recombinase/integrase, partial [Candidatus Cybelea sp.]